MRRPLFTSSMTGKVSPYKHRFGPSMPDVFHVPFPVEHHGVSVRDSLQALDYLFRASISPSQVAAIVIEPVQGEGGFYIAPAELMAGLRRVCDQHGIALVADEVQTGFGRTGRMFAIEHMGIEPDLITVAKSIAGGFPLSGVIGRAALMDTKALVGRSDMPPISALRGLGAMVAFELTNAAGEPDAAMTKRVTSSALEEGLVLLCCGVFSNVIRLLVPLTVSDDVLTVGLQRMEAALRVARRG